MKKTSPLKKIPFFSLFILLGICAACQGTETPTSIATIPPSPAATQVSSAIAFYSHRDGNLELYLMNPDGSDQRRVTSNEFDDDSPALSPTGTQIAFISSREDPNPGACAHSCFYQLYRINVDGSDERRLVETEFSTTHPDWSPDGTRISFDTEYNLQGDIYIVNSDGSNLQLLVEDGFWADWSPDGRQIVFASKRDGNVELYLADADGDNQRRLTQTERMEYFPDWSPDGQRIAFTVLQPRAIYVLDVEGGNEGRVTHESFAENPSWSPDSKWIAYQSDVDGDFDIYAVHVDEALAGSGGTAPIKLTDNKIGDLWPSWGMGAAR